MCVLNCKLYCNLQIFKSPSKYEIHAQIINDISTKIKTNIKTNSSSLVRILANNISIGENIGDAGIHFAIHGYVPFSHQKLL